MVRNLSAMKEVQDKTFVEVRLPADIVAESQGDSQILINRFSWISKLA